MYQDEELAVGLRDSFLTKIHSGNPTVLLVGARPQRRDSLRAKLRYELASRPRTHEKAAVYYPEDLFDDLLSEKLGHSYNLLELENLLAKGVHAVVIMLEGAGAIAELGAFCNHLDLSKKLIVIVNEQHRHDRSFIMLGPVRQLRQNDKNSVVFFDFESPATDRLGLEVRSRLRRLYRGSTISGNPDNPIVAQDYLLAAVFIRQPITIDDAAHMIKVASGEMQDNPAVIARMALSILETRRLVSVTQGEYRINRQGIETLKTRIAASGQDREIWSSLDQYRVRYLNRAVRKLKLSPV